jgi:long-chain fatty acid transport protein
MKKAIIAVLIMMMIPVAVMASGFALYDGSAKAMGMGSAFIGRADDASAIYYNPAGLAFLEGTNVLIGITPIMPHVTVELGGNSWDSEQRWVFAPSAYFSTKITENIAVGFGMFVPNGLGMQFNEQYGGNFISYRSMSMGVYFRPTIAFKVNENLALAAGVDIVYSKLMHWRKFPYAMLDPNLAFLNMSADERSEGDGMGYGFVASALYKADKFQFGVKYRHQVEVDYEGDADFTLNASGIPTVDGMFGAIFKDQILTTTMTIPGEISAGIMVIASDDLSFTADFSYTLWEVIDTITMTHSEPVTAAMLGPNDVWTMNWENTWMLRLGTEYWLNREFAVRAGFALDHSPIPNEHLTPFAPDGDRTEFTVGMGYDTKEACCWGRFFADVAYRYVGMAEGTSEFAYFPATYSGGYANLLSMSVGFSF